MLADGGDDGRDVRAFHCEKAAASGEAGKRDVAGSVRHRRHHKVDVASGERHAHVKRREQRLDVAMTDHHALRSARGSPRRLDPRDIVAAMLVVRESVRKRGCPLLHGGAILRRLVEAAHALQRRQGRADLLGFFGHAARIEHVFAAILDQEFDVLLDRIARVHRLPHRPRAQYAEQRNERQRRIRAVERYPRASDQPGGAKPVRDSMRQRGHLAMAVVAHGVADVTRVGRAGETMVEKVDRSHPPTISPRGRRVQFAF